MVEGESETSGVGAEGRVAVVVNGNAKRVTEQIVAVLDQIVQSGDLYVSRSLDEGRDIARIIVERGYPTVLTGGGDGTFSQTVTWIDQECRRQGKPMPRFGLLKLGTGNALAWVLGAQYSRARGVFADLARLRTEGGSSRLNMIDVEGRLVPFAGVGSDAIALKHYGEVIKAFGKLPVLRSVSTGGVAYLVSLMGRTLPDQVLKPRFQVRIVNEHGGAVRLNSEGQPITEPAAEGQVIHEGSARMVIMSTVPYWGFGVRVFPFAMDREDLFSLRVIDFEPAEALRHLRAIWKGTFRHPKLYDYLVRDVSIHCEEPIPVQVGGDILGAREVIHARLRDEPIRVVDYYSPPPVDQ